jgi:aspartate ammonia-lyase
MPGKVNPIIPEVVNQVAYEVIGNDMTVTMAAEAGQLELNAMEPVIAFNLFRSIDMLRQACRTLVERCIDGITANRERCRKMVENSIGLVTALNPIRAMRNLRRSQTLVTGGRFTTSSWKRLPSERWLDEVLSPERMTRPWNKLR